jgi:hypothetical protein
MDGLYERFGKVVAWVLCAGVVLTLVLAVVWVATLIV